MIVIVPVFSSGGAFAVHIPASPFVHEPDQAGGSVTAVDVGIHARKAFFAEIDIVFHAAV
jgi:hypothetical protein